MSAVLHPSQEREPGAAREPDAPRLQRLADVFSLDDFDRHVIAALWKATFDSEWRSELLAGERFQDCITPRGIGAAFGFAERARLSSESPLRSWNLVDEQPLPDGTASLGLDPQILAWLDGQHELDRALVGHAAAVPPESVPALCLAQNWPIAAWATRLAEGLRAGLRWRVQISSAGEPDREAEMACGVALGLQLRMPVLALQTRSPALVPRLHRQAYLDHCMPCVPGEASPPLGIECTPFPLECVLGAGEPARADQRFFRAVLPALRLDDRRRLWRAAVPSAAAWPEDALQRLALQAEGGASDILRAAAGAPASPQQAAEALAATQRGELQGLVQRIDAAFVWDDLVLPAHAIERLKEIEFEAGERHAVWADAAVARLYPQGRGVVALFAGPPGTGKTMAAQVIAAGLGMDLLRVDLSAVISKWVGETAQHLQKILSARTSRRAVLFFDEADALYGKRVEDTRDAQDRYANMDLSHLMVALESFDGVVLLATNLKANIDGAFLRRIRHCVDFARPDRAARAAIWRRVLATAFPRAQGLQVDRLAGLETTGAQIKQAVLSALFTTRRFGTEPDTRLLAGLISREIAKEGGGISARDLAAVSGDEGEVS